MRNVICHYHFFKNAGTSVDKILQANFGAAWRSYEGDGKRPDLSSYIADDPRILAVSSHTASLPVPEIEGVAIWPIFFLRHPIERFLSVYEFERTQGATTEGAKVASSKSIQGYLRWRLSRPTDRAICDFHVYRLSRACAFRGKPSRAEELHSAKNFLGAAGFFGIVERFRESLDWLEAWLRQPFPTVKLQLVHANVTNRQGASVGDRLKVLQDRLGDDLFERLNNGNQADMKLYEYATELFSRRMISLRAALGAAAAASLSR